LHEARQYQVERFDYDGRKAYVRRVDSDYFTDAIDYTQVKELEEFESREVNGARAAHGDVRVNTQVVGFKKVRFYTLENVGAGNLSMPEREMQTTAFWLRFPETFLARFPDLTPTEKQNGLTGLANVLQTVAALLLMCDPHDLGIAIAEDISKGTRSFEPDLFLFDNYPGAMDVLRSCSCEAGCPACVGPVGEVGERGKEVAQRILNELAKEEVLQGGVAG
jgi:DEAD/DEAH box helicase domain-containing protein